MTSRPLEACSRDETERGLAGRRIIGANAPIIWKRLGEISSAPRVDIDAFRPMIRN